MLESNFDRTVGKTVTLNGTNYSRVDQVKFFKGCLPQISLGPFLNILSQIRYLHAQQYICSQSRKSIRVLVASYIKISKFNSFSGKNGDKYGKGSNSYMCTFMG